MLKNKGVKLNLVLASRSPYRKMQLEKLNFLFETVDSQINEDIVKQENLTPIEIAKKLAYLKAQFVFTQTRFKDTVIIGADQLVSFENQILGKTPSMTEAFEQLSMLQGRTHQLISAVCILSPQGKFEHQNISEMTMKPLTSREIQAYIQIDKPFDCAGTYKFELHGKSLFSNVQTDDESAILGLPTLWLEKTLEQILK